MKIRQYYFLFVILSDHSVNLTIATTQSQAIDTSEREHVNPKNKSEKAIVEKDDRSKFACKITKVPLK